MVDVGKVEGLNEIEVVGDSEDLSTYRFTIPISNGDSSSETKIKYLNSCSTKAMLEVGVGTEVGTRLSSIEE